jgi:hypothetical protein
MIGVMFDVTMVCARIAVRRKAARYAAAGRHSAPRNYVGRRRMAAA